MRKDEAVYRDIDHIDPKVPEYFLLSPTEREVYHFVGIDQSGVSVYLYQGLEDKHIPTINGGPPTTA